MSGKNSKMHKSHFRGNEKAETRLSLFNMVFL